MIDYYYINMIAILTGRFFIFVINKFLKIKQINTFFHAIYIEAIFILLVNGLK